MGMIKKGIMTVSASAALMALLAGCGQSNKDVAGTYHAELKLIDWMGEEEAANMEEMEAAGMGFLSETVLEMELVMTEEGEYSITPQVDEMVSYIRNGFEENLEAIFEGMLKEEGIEEDQYETMAQNAGYDDFESFKAAAMEIMLKEMESGMDGYLETVKTEAEEINISGDFQYKGDVITFVEINDNGSDAEGTVGENGDITIHDIETDGMKFDLVFTK